MLLSQINDPVTLIEVEGDEVVNMITWCKPWWSKQNLPRPPLL